MFGYIKRYDHYYLRLDRKGVGLVKTLGYTYKNGFRNEQYIKRLKELAKIAAISIGSNIIVKPSWDMKNNIEFTATSRKYLCEINYNNKTMLTYNIPRDKKVVYIKQVICDINKAKDYDRIAIFVDNFNILNSKYKYFVFGKKETLIIKNTKENRDILSNYKNNDFYERIKNTYKDSEILLSNWDRANYMIDKKHYIILMPYIDTERVARLISFHKLNKSDNRQIDIFTLKENIDTLSQMLFKDINIIELDGGIENARKD